MYYEAHLTVTNPEPEQVKAIVETTKWLFSAIDGDVVEPKRGVKSYATTHFNAKRDPLDVVQEINKMAQYLEMAGCTVSRQKLELVMYDTKQSEVDPEKSTPLENYVMFLGTPYEKELKSC